uniref:Protein kinase domain-containing protein n=1 Tax=Ananas comosus var. bracteatus TaxID=296719 RepID=A0A6V7PMJ6_ANACO|nr:unnamed protein product [Ananas comosus var. bracteatus]
MEPHGGKAGVFFPQGGFFAQNAENLPPGPTGLPANSQGTNAAFVDPIDTPQQVLLNFAPSHIPVKQPMAEKNMFLADGNPSGNGNEPQKPSVLPNIDIGVPNDLGTEQSLPRVENSYAARPDVRGNEMHHTIDFALSGHYHLQNLQPVNASHLPHIIGNNGLYHYYYETGAGAAGIPMSNYGIGMVYASNNMNTIREWKDVAPQIHHEQVLSEIAAPLSGNAQSSSATATADSGNVEQPKESLLPDSLFPSEDPWKVLENTHALPPKPRKVAVKESAGTKDATVPSNEGDFHNINNVLSKEPFTEPIRHIRGDEQVKQDMQAIEQGLMASVLQLSEPPQPVSAAREAKDSVAFCYEGSGATKNNLERENKGAEVINSLQPEKIKIAIPITEDIGHLQIIKNSDIETVARTGFWNFWCFAGKPSEQERMISDFWNEASKLADLHHPNVVAFYGVVLDGPGGDIATVTEYMVNGSLRHALQKTDKTLDRRKRLIIAMDAAFGMEYLHSKNIVHFDLKSDNLLVNLRDPQRPICKVGDLGLSRVKCQTLISGGVRGTLPWMAPELLNGSSNLVSEKVDVFSFGIVLWELLTGEEPYADLHYGVIIGGIVSNKLRPQVPEYCDPEWRSLRSMAASPQKGQS